MLVIDRFISSWHNNLINSETYIRTYQTIKKSFRLEPYLYLVRETPFRNAIAQIRASSNTLAIERGRHTRPKTPIQERLCKSCVVIEDEANFILSFQLNQSLMVNLMKNIETIYPEFNNMTENEQIYFIFNDVIVPLLCEAYAYQCNGYGEVVIPLFRDYMKDMHNKKVVIWKWWSHSSITLWGYAYQDSGYREVIIP